MHADQDSPLKAWEACKQTWQQQHQGPSSAAKLHGKDPRFKGENKSLPDGTDAVHVLMQNWWQPRKKSHKPTKNMIWARRLKRVWTSFIWGFTHDDNWFHNGNWVCNLHLVPLYRMEWPTSHAALKRVQPFHPSASRQSGAGCHSSCVYQ